VLIDSAKKTDQPASDVGRQRSSADPQLDARHLGTDSAFVPVIRSASLVGYAELVRRLGGDPQGLAANACVPPEALDSGEVMIPLQASCQALELAAEQLRCPDFGLRLADDQRLENLGPLAVALLHSPNLGDALECASRFLTSPQPRQLPRRGDDPYEVPGTVGLRFVLHYEGRAYPQTMDKMILNVHRVIERLTGGRYDGARA
jgi:Arabinose-binding domain of AraC transcription regulator, N-term